MKHQQALVVFEQIPRVRENNAVAHLPRRASGIMVDWRLQDLLHGDEVGELGGRRKDGVEDSTSQLGGLSVQPAKLDCHLWRILKHKGPLKSNAEQFNFIGPKSDHCLALSLSRSL